eukprot:m.76208 g.76208  ORF g.76208 m.76208 type:complete len:104 (+) comp12547_c0_seq2:1049-1360(+)
MGSCWGTGGVTPAGGPERGLLVVFDGNGGGTMGPFCSTFEESLDFELLSRIDLVGKGGGGFEGPRGTLLRLVDILFADDLACPLPLGAPILRRPLGFFLDPCL